MDDPVLQRELEAQKRRVEALKYLSTQGQNVDSAEKVIQNIGKSSSQTDNTLELLLKQRASSSDSRELERRSKAALLASQNIFSAPQPQGKREPSESYQSNIGGKKIVVGTEEWTSAIHTATKQEYWINTRTGEKKFEVPTESTQGSGGLASGLAAQAQAQETAVADSKQKKRKASCIDPLDPMDGKVRSDGPFTFVKHDF